MILMFYEHYAREYEFLAVLKKRLASVGCESIIAHIYCEKSILNWIEPTLVCVPFLYGNQEQLAGECIRREIPVINLAWEQILYPIKASRKHPNGIALNPLVIHACWGREYRRRLTSAGADSKNIVNVGNYNFQLIKNKLKDNNQIRAKLALLHGLDEAKQWVVISENFSWALMPNGKFKKFQQVDRVGANEARENATSEFLQLVDDLNNLPIQFYDKHEVIFRPRPSTNFSDLYAFFNKHNIELKKSIKIIKEHSFSDWAVCASHILSTLSTTLVDAASADIKVALLNYGFQPQSIAYAWMEYAERIEKVDHESLQNLAESSRLKDWITDEFYDGNPTEILSAVILKLCNNINNAKATLKKVLITPLLLTIFFKYKLFGKRLQVKYKRSVDYTDDLKSIIQRIY